MIVKDMLNIVEDIRIEVLQETHWRGCAVNLRNMRDNIYKRVTDEAWASKDHLERIMILIFCYARGGVTEPFVARYGMDYAGIIEALDPEIEQAKLAKNTAEALVIAKEILRRLEEMIEEMEKEEDSDDEMERIRIPGEGGDPGEGEPLEDEADVPVGGGKPDDKGKDKKIVKKLKEAMKDPGKKREMPSAADIIRKEADAFKGYRPYSTCSDSFKPPEIIKIDTLAHYEKIRQGLSQTAGVLKKQMLRILLSRKRSKWVGGKRRGTLNPATLHQAVNGTSDQLYRERKIGRKINTAVSILVDLSGSMGGDKILKARETTILLAEGINPIGIPFEILGFTGDLKDAAGSFKEKESERTIARKFDRWGSLDMVYFKLFEEPFGQEQKKRIASMTSHSQNYDGESVQYAADRLLKRPEPKKILFVLSDGAPAASRCRMRSLSPHLKAVTRKLESIPGFYLVGFGIKTEAPAKYYNETTSSSTT